MTKRNKTNATLLSCGSLIPDLHYGPFSRDWWYTTTIENEVLLVPIRLGMIITTTINGQKFILRVVQGHPKHLQQPGYCCQAGVLSSNVEESCSAALTSLYQHIFQTKTKFSGPQELGLDDNKIVDQLLNGILFRPFYVSVDKFQILYIHWANENSHHHLSTFEGDTPAGVWKKIGILQKLDGFALFGLEDDYTKKRLESRELPTCRPTDWTNDETMDELYSYYLKKRTLANINWRKKRAWQVFFRAAGCINITPFGIDKYKCGFWTKEINPLHDQETLYTLFENGFLRTIPFDDSSKSCNDLTERLASCLIESYEANKKGVEGKRRILSIVADKFSLQELKLMKMSSRTIQEARTFARINGPGCSIIEKPTIHRTRFSEEAKDQFEKFFSDKSIVNMSSYKVDPQTKLPVLYLKDNKTALWEKFLETYPDGYKRTTFMTELANTSLLVKSILIDKVEKVRRHMKRDYEKEISINTNGQVNHDPCISHCLAYAFGICKNTHVSICEKCNKLWILFTQLQSNLDESCSEILNEAFKQKINKPEPTCTSHSAPKESWNIPIPDPS
ncbi:247_t:CDS:2, partial [Diversispora eburnea]